MKNKNIKAIKFLLNRWKKITPLCAIEMANKSCQNELEKMGIKTDDSTENFTRPLEHLKIIKHKIIEICPDLDWIKEDYKSDIKLQYEDLAQIYCEHQSIMIQKATKIIKNSSKV